VTREVLLGQVEGGLATCQQELKEKTEALATQAKKAKEVEAELLADGTEAYGAGFEDALAQVACKHPEMDIAFFTLFLTCIFCFTCLLAPLDSRPLLTTLPYLTSS